MPGAGIGEINAVEKDHGLVERASPDEDVGLRSLASAFADIDRRSKAQGGFQSLDRRRGLGFPVEKRGVRLGAAHGSRLAPRDADLPYPPRFEDSGRIGILRGRTLRRKQQDRHPDGENPDRPTAAQTRKDRPALAVPTPPVSSGALFCLDVFHVFEIWVNKKQRFEPVRLHPSAQTAAKIRISGRKSKLARILPGGSTFGNRDGMRTDGRKTRSQAARQKVPTP